MAKVPAEFDQTSDLHTVNQATVTWGSGINPTFSGAIKNDNIARLNLVGTLSAAKRGDSILATLPYGYTPKRNQLVVFEGKYNNVLQPCFAIIKTDGSITLSNGPQNFPSGDVIAFDTIYFLD